MEEIQQKSEFHITVKKFLEEKKTEFKSTRDEMIEALGIGYSTFYSKLENNRFSKLELEKLNEITGIDFI